jgi:pimeloyl-ACP methyl ester carboxylesterase
MKMYRYPGETRSIDDEVRSSSLGEYIELSRGITHYEIAGPLNGQPVVLLHGFSIPYQIWDPIFRPLAEAGFCVLRYDLYGRGTSDRPQVSYDQDLFDLQLLELLKGLKLKGSVDLVGLSMGGGISVIFCDRHPELVRRLILIDPVGFPLLPPIWAKFVVVPILGELFLSLISGKFLVKTIAEGVYGGDRYPEFVEVAHQQMKFVGYRQALLSTLRSDVLDDLSEIFHRVGNKDRPSMLIWGTLDRAVPFKMSEKVREAIPNIEFHAIQGAGHIPHYERPEVVTPMIIDFLKKL